MIVGVTGATRGGTPAQLVTLRELLTLRGITVVHHGDAIGWDAQAHKIVQDDAPHVRLIGHPPDRDGKRAFCEGFAEIRPPAPFLVRDDDIARESELLIAGPESDEEVLRSGTWSTIRYARKYRKMIIHILLDGSVRLE